MGIEIWGDDLIIINLASVIELSALTKNHSVATAKL